MKHKLLLSFVFLSVFCAAQTTVVDSIMSGGIYRNYRLYIPAAYNGSVSYPLILNIHGYTSSASAQQPYSNFEPIADTAHFLMVYPNATKYMGQPTWNSGFGLSVNDVQFLSELIDSLSAAYNIDQNSVYSCGMSNGGYMSYTLACALSNKIAAVASVCGTMTPFQRSTCSPGRPVPAMQIHGTSDGTVPYNGTTASLAIDTLVKYWVMNDGCNPVPAFSTLPNTNTSDGCTAEHYVYGGGAMGSTVELYKIIGGGHTWPGSPFTIGVTNQDFKSSEKIWLFFRKYKLNQFVGIEERKKEAEVLIWPNPASNTLTIEAEHLLLVQIINSEGKIMLQSAKAQIDISSLVKGIYSVVIISENSRAVKKLVKM